MWILEGLTSHGCSVCISDLTLQFPFLKIPLRNVTDDAAAAQDRMPVRSKRQ